VESLGEAVRAVGRVSELSRRQCRQVFEERFSARRMAQDYADVYYRLVANEGPELGGQKRTGWMAPVSGDGRVSANGGIKARFVPTAPLAS
jgi:hypothetical protein